MICVSHFILQFHVFHIVCTSRALLLLEGSFRASFPGFGKSRCTGCALAGGRVRALAGRHGFIYHSTKMTQKIFRLIVSVFDVTPEFFFDRDKFFSTDKYRNFGKSGTGL